MKAVELAKQTIEEYVKNGKVIEAPEKLEDIEVERAGTFVSIKTKSNELRGCIGTISPTADTVAKEIVRNAIAAATQDPRFYPIKENELGNLKISVDILHPPEHVKSLDELDPQIYGVIVSADGKRGLLLPNLEGVESVEEQIEISKRKAGITHAEHASVQRFKVDRYSEN